MTRYTITDFDTLGAIAGSEFVYVATTTGSIKNYKLTLAALGAWIGGGGGSVSWGGIAGTLSNQTDLQAALNLKANSSSLAAVATTGAYSSLSGLPTLGTVAALSYPGGTTTYLRADGTWATVSGGSGDVVGPASSTSGNLPSFSGTTGKLLQDSGVLASSVVVGPASVTSGRVASYNGTTGKLIADGGILVADVVTGPASATSGRVATFNGTTGKIIQDGGTLLSALATLASPALTGTPTTPQAAVDNNSGTIASTSYVVGQAASATPQNNGTAAVGTSLRYARGDHVHNSDTTKANISGVTFTGLVTTVASATGTAGLNVPHGVAPTTPVNGDLWTTTAGLFARINGATVGPYAIAGLSNPMTTSQDIIVGGASGTPTRLAVGGNGTFLGVSAGSITWTTPSGSGDFVGPASSVTGNLVSFNGTTGKLGADSGVLAANVPTMASAAAGSGNVITSAGANRTQQDSAVAIANIPTMAANAGATGRVLTSAGSNKTVQDSGTLLSALATLASPTFTGTPAAPTAALGTNTTQIATMAAVQQEKGTVLTSFSAAYNIVLADANTILFHPSSDTTARTVTIPANGTIAMVVGTLITIDNQIGAGALTVAITTDTLEWVGTGATGSRTIAAGGQATIMKVTSTRWRLSGVGVT